MSVDAINKRYSGLAEKTCCLSCGGALNHGTPQKGETCLDLGSGRGNDVLRMAELTGAEGYAYGLDISDGMLEKAEKTATKLGVENVTFLRSELETIPLENNMLDLVISNCTINHASDKYRVWSEIHRTLKDGGRFVVSDIYSLETVPKEYRNDPQAVSECWAGSVTKEKYFDTLEKCGFKDLSIIEESDPYEKGKIKVASFTVKGYK